MSRSRDAGQHYAYGCAKRKVKDEKQKKKNKKNKLLY